MVAGSHLRPLVPEMSVPWQVVGGAADELSPSSWVPEIARLNPAPTSVTLYAGGRHAMTETPAAALGPSWRGLTVDWLHDRGLGREGAAEHRLVPPPGQVFDLPPLRGAVGAPPDCPGARLLRRRRRRPPRHRLA